MKDLRNPVPASSQTIDNAENKEDSLFTFNTIFIALILSLIGFIGSQKVMPILSDPSSSYSFSSLSEFACDSGLRFQFLKCDDHFFKLEEINPSVSSEIFSENQENKLSTNTFNENDLLIKDMLTDDNSPNLREQFAHLPNLQAALEKLQWNNGSEQDAVRFLTLISTLSYGRQREAHLVTSAHATLLKPLWKDYPELVAASHCLYCGSFFNYVIKPFIQEGSTHTAFLHAVALGHPRYLKVVSDSNQLPLNDVTDIVKLQAEISSSGDAATAKFIGDILIRENEIDLLNHWASKGWNGSYAINNHNNLEQLPRNLIINAWQRGIARASDNALITRHLVGTGYRPALRWLLWSHAGDLAYFKNRQHQQHKNAYNNHIIKDYFAFPQESYKDLASFYSNHWRDIHWDKNSSKWIYKMRH